MLIPDRIEDQRLLVEKLIKDFKNYPPWGVVIHQFDQRPDEFFKVVKDIHTILDMAEVSPRGRPTQCCGRMRGDLEEMIKGIYVSKSNFAIALAMRGFQLDFQDNRGGGLFNTNLKYADWKRAMKRLGVYDRHGYETFKRIIQY